MENLNLEMVRKIGLSFVVAVVMALVKCQPETVEVVEVLIETVIVEVEVEKPVIETVVVEKYVEVEKIIIETVEVIREEVIVETVPVGGKEIVIETVIVEREVTPTPVVPVTMFSAPGTFRVGVDIEPGIYKVEGAGDIPDCYWARLSCFDGTSACVLADKTVTAFGYVEVMVTDLALETQVPRLGTICTFILQE